MGSKTPNFNHKALPPVINEYYGRQFMMYHHIKQSPVSTAVAASRLPSGRNY